MTCFQKGTLKLQPENSQVNSTFTQTIRVLKRFTFSTPVKVGFPHHVHNTDHCSLFSIADTTCNGGIVEHKLVRKTNLPFIPLEIKKVQFSAVLEEVFTLVLPVNCTWRACNVPDKRRGITAKHENKRCHYYILSLYEIACISALPFVKGFDYNPP